MDNSVERICGALRDLSEAVVNQRAGIEPPRPFIELSIHSTLTFQKH